jgi:hypothetical protein
MFYVYEHILLATGQSFYVGKGKNNRAYSKHRSQKWHNFVNKYGDYVVKFLIKDIEEEFAFLIEEEVIDSYRKRGYNLANISNGGEGVSGIDAWNKGKKLSDTHVKNLSESHKNKKWSALQLEAQTKPEIKKKHSQAVKNAMANPETKERHRIAVSLAKKGKKQTEEHKKATSIAISRWWAKRKSEKDSLNEMA